MRRELGCFEAVVAGVRKSDELDGPVISQGNQVSLGSPVRTAEFLLDIGSLGEATGFQFVDKPRLTLVENVATVSLSTSYFSFCDVTGDMRGDICHR